MNREDDQQLWDLLGKSEAPEASPFFARNVLRAIRATESLGPRWSHWLRARVLIPSSAVAAAVVAALISLHSPTVQKPSRGGGLRSIAQSEAEDADLAADIDDLIGGDDDTAADTAIR
jgi:hypothetical protein